MPAVLSSSLGMWLRRGTPSVLPAAHAKLDLRCTSFEPFKLLVAGVQELVLAPRQDAAMQPLPTFSPAVMFELE
jgi:hypothetical protein